MQNQAPLSPARILYQELCDTGNAGLLDTWHARGQANDPAAAPNDVAASNYVDINSTKPATAYKVAQTNAENGVDDDDTEQPKSALAAINRLQSTEIEHLALENDRLAARLDAVSQLHEDERDRRRNLDRQLLEANLRNDPPAPAFDLDEVRRAARDGMSAEIKPVLMAILDLLETTLPRSADLPRRSEKAHPATVVEAMPAPAPDPAPANLIGEVMDELQRLPEILTRPIEELTSGSDKVGSTPARVVDPSVQAVQAVQVTPRETRPRQPRPPRCQAQPSTMPGAMPSAMPGAFAWTSLFS